MPNPVFNSGRAWSIARKEFWHVVRDPFTLLWALGMPVILVLFFGYAIDFNVKEVKLVVADRDHTRASRELQQTMQGSDYFKLYPLPAGIDPQTLLFQEKAKGVMIIEPGFGRDLGLGRNTRAQVLLDGADNSSAGTILSYLAGLQQAASQRLLGRKQVLPLTLSTRFLFNPELNSQWFIVPGLIAMVMGILSIILTALTVAREWEMGSMELLLSTPVKPLEIIFGKLLPYLGLVTLSVVVIYLIARFQFGIPFQGDHGLYLISVFLFLTLCLAQGVLISVVTRQQVLSVQLGFITGLLPTLLLSGFIFPIESMPMFFQWLTLILPPRWFVLLSRALFLKGTGVVDLIPPLGALLVLNLMIVGAALRAFKQDVEP
jgi:ABC-2 type transport system permease protein